MSRTHEPADDGTATPADGHNAQPPIRKVGRRRVVSGPTPDPHPDGPPERSADDEDEGWGEPGADSNDERLRRDKPPHW